MLGAIIGDIIGSVYEWNNIKTTEFPLFSKRCRPTDDSVMSIAVADGLIRSFRKDEETIKKALIASMQHYGRKYPRAGYGGRFYDWLMSDDPQPYNSWGNGSAMRVSSVGWMAASLVDAEELARVTAEVTHNHEEGVRGAKAIAAAVYMARAKCSKEEIKGYIEKYHGYELSVSLDEIRDDYDFDVSCKGSVPWAIRAFLEAGSYEEAVRLAVSIGGDSDTIACMAGSIAGPFFGIPENIKKSGLAILDDYLKDKLKEYRSFYNEYCAEPDGLTRSRVKAMLKGPYAGGNPKIEEALKKWHEGSCIADQIPALLDIIAGEMREDLEVLTAVSFPEGMAKIPEDPAEEETVLRVPVEFRILGSDDGTNWAVAFTNAAESTKGEKTSTMPILFTDLIDIAEDVMKCDGIAINPFGDHIKIPNSILKIMLNLARPVPRDVQDLNAGAEAYQKGDYETAVRLYQKAADAGNVTALSNLGYCYYYGRSIPVDKEKARSCWEKAAALGDVCSIYKLGDMYRNGDLPEDPVFSGNLYMQAFHKAVEEKDLWNYPDVSLRILKYCRDEFDPEDLKKIAEDCVKGLEERIKQGDTHSGRLLEEAKEIRGRLE